MANLLAAKDPGARLDELITAIDNPAVVRDAFRESFVGSMSTSTGGVTKVTPKAVEDFQRMYPTLQRLFADAPTELRAIQTAVERTKVDLLRESIPGTKLTSGLDELDSLLASAGAATVLEMGFTGTHALMVGGAIRRQIMSMLGKGQIDPAKAKVPTRIFTYFSDGAAYTKYERGRPHRKRYYSNGSAEFCRLPIRHNSRVTRITQCQETRAVTTHHRRGIP